jgi:hypothetical protein
MVFIPVKEVTVADPPKISIELTIMLVERLFVQINNGSADKEGDKELPEEHKNKMRKSSPSHIDYFKPRVRIRGVKFQLRGKLESNPNVKSVMRLGSNEHTMAKSKI